MVVDRSGVRRVAPTGVAHDLGVPIDPLLDLQVDVHPDGTAFNIAGKCKASAGSMIAAIELATELAVGLARRAYRL